MSDDYLKAAVEIAREAGAILREEFDRPPEISYKGDVDLVTQADKRSEAAIVKRLTQYFPEHAIAAEEGTGHESASHSEFRWHIDPLDGKKIHVSKVATLSTSLLCTGFPVHKRLANPNIQYYWDFTLRSHGVRRDGSAALDLACVAAGRFDGFWEFGLQKWDTAAGVLLVEEAGGKVSDFSGQPYQLGGPMILATNGTIHEEMREVALEISQRDPASPLRR